MVLGFSNGYYVIITERIIMILDIEIDHLITYPMIYLVLSRIDENIAVSKVYLSLDTL